MSVNNTPTRPGEAALINMKLLKTESNVFKVPKVPKTRTTRKQCQVMEEDEYVEKITKLIQRDFFPDLEKLNAQNEYLEATENKDYDRLREITRKYSSGQRPPTEPYNSPATFDTPNIDRPSTPCMPTVRGHRTPGDERPPDEKLKDITDNHTLDSFLASHTSEDNASYERVIELEDRKRVGKLAVQFEAEVTSAAAADIAHQLPSIEQQADQTNRAIELDTWRYKARNYIMYVPEGAASQPPSARPTLRHRNTRLSGPVFDHAKNKQAISAIAKSQEAIVSGKIGVDGASVCPESGAGVGAGLGAGVGAGLVPPPSPRPGELPDRSPLMTWGEIEGTPFRLDGGDTPLPAVGSGAAYRMLEGGAREKLALRLAERTRRATPRPSAGTPLPTFRTNTERLASMSPAARKLAAKHLLSPRLRLTPNDVGIFHNSATPKRTPTRQLVVTPTIGKKVGTQQRPSNSGSVNNSDKLTENNNLTDNLLQINVAKRSRLKAHDFFT